MSRYSKLVLDKPTPSSQPTIQASHRRNKSQTTRTSSITKRCECCGLEYSISYLVDRNYDPIANKSTKVCIYCNKHYSDSQVDRYSYDISYAPVSWLTGSHTKRESRY